MLAQGAVTRSQEKGLELTPPDLSLILQLRVCSLGEKEALYFAL